MTNLSLQGVIWVIQTVNDHHLVLSRVLGVHLDKEGNKEEDPPPNRITVTMVIPTCTSEARAVMPRYFQLLLAAVTKRTMAWAAFSTRDALG